MSETVEPSFTRPEKKPFSEPCERNKDPILQQLHTALAECRSVLEIGSGSGQHAVYFAERLPWLRWQASDVPANLPGIAMWLEESSCALPAPLAVDMFTPDWPDVAARLSPAVDGVFSANTAHILSWLGVQSMFAGVGGILAEGGVFCLYGPFNYKGVYTSESNARFDLWLKERDPASGIRDMVDLEALGGNVGLALAQDVAMPANNRLLLWRKTAQR